MSTRTVLFDLGGVVVDVNLDWSRQLWASTTDSDHMDFDRVFLDSGIKDQIDRGQLGELEALSRIRTLHGKPLDDEQIRQCWTACLRTRPDATQLVHRVAQHAACAVLSNTDPIHSAWIEEHAGIHGVIGQWIFSYQCQSMKPEPAIFEFALQRLGADASNTVLLDDRADNIAAAHRLGIDTIHFTGFNSVCAALAERQLIPADWAPSL